MLSAGKGRGAAGRWALGAASGAVLLLGLLGTGCAAQNDLSEDPDWTRDPGVESGKWREVQSLFGGERSAADSGKHALRSVRLDLSMSKSGRPDARCGCVEVAVGRARDRKFRWAGEPPSVSRQDMVIALRHANGSCAGGSVYRRPSIQAVNSSKGNVVVVIEELSYNRPEALGAIISQPRPGAAVYLRAAKGQRRTVNAGAASPAGACRVYYRPGKAVDVGATGR